MKILFINQVFYPDTVSSAQHLTDLAVYLAENGHDVTVLAGQRGYLDPHPVFSLSENYRGVKIVRIRQILFNRKSKIARIAGSLFFNLSVVWKLFFMPRFQSVVAMTSPPLVAWFACKIARLRNSRFVYWIMDLNPDQVIETGWIKRGSFLARFLKARLASILKKSDKVIVLDRFMRDKAIDYGAPTDKTEIIPPWPHEEIYFIEKKDNPFIKKHGLEGKYTVMYSGNHSICHPLDTLLQAALKLKNEMGIIFLFIGGGERVRDVLSFKETNNLENIRHLPYVARDELKYSLGAADLHVVVMGEPYVGIVHPCKIYGILKLGQPFVYIGPDRSHIGDLMEGVSRGFHVSHGDAERLAQAILSHARKGKNKVSMDNPVQKAVECSTSGVLIKRMADAVTEES